MEQKRENNNLERFAAGFLILVIVILIWYFLTDPAKAISYLIAALVIAVIFIFLTKWLHKKSPRG